MPRAVPTYKGSETFFHNILRKTNDCSVCRNVFVQTIPKTRALPCKATISELATSSEQHAKHSTDKRKTHSDARAPHKHAKYRARKRLRRGKLVDGRLSVHSGGLGLSYLCK
jgi:hypothetical protein